MIREKPLQQFQILILIYQRLYQELTGEEYDCEPRDWKQAKLFMQEKDWNSEVMELKLRAHLPQYLKDDFWKDQNFPAYGLFTQWNKYKPAQVRATRKPIPPPMLLCPDCGESYPMNSICPCLTKKEAE